MNIFAPQSGRSGIRKKQKVKGQLLYIYSDEKTCIITAARRKHQRHVRPEGQREQGEEQSVDGNTRLRRCAGAYQACIGRRNHQEPSQYVVRGRSYRLQGKRQNGNRQHP